MRKELAILAALVAVTSVGLYVFRDGFGVFVFAVVGMATVVQAVHVLIGLGRSRTLKQWWSALKDAFWGID